MTENSTFEQEKWLPNYNNIPESYNTDNGASTFSGCAPVNRIKRGSRGTWASGVPMSIASTLVGFTDGGGSGIDTSDSSSLLSERGGVGGR